MYLSLVKKIWSSKLSAINKTMAHNAFATPVWTLAIGILDWTLQEIKDINIRTGRLLFVTGNFYPNTDVYRLYIQRNHGRGGLRSWQRLFVSRTVAIKQYLYRKKERNPIINHDFNEESSIIQVGNKLMQQYNIINNND